eukprot:1159668-Pelagomonas_calceolata.AAC.6
MGSREVHSLTLKKKTVPSSPLLANEVASGDKAREVTAPCSQKVKEIIIMDLWLHHRHNTHAFVELQRGYTPLKLVACTPAAAALSDVHLLSVAMQGRGIAPHGWLCVQPGGAGLKAYALSIHPSIHLSMSCRPEGLRAISRTTPSLKPTAATCV